MAFRAQLFPDTCERGWGDKNQKKAKLKRAVGKPTAPNSCSEAGALYRLYRNPAWSHTAMHQPITNTAPTRLGRPSVGARAAAQSLEKVGLELPAKRLEGEARLQQCVVSSE